MVTLMSPSRDCVRHGDNHANNITQNTLYDRIAGVHRREGMVRPGQPRPRNIINVKRNRTIAYSTFGRSRLSSPLGGPKCSFSTAI